MEELFSTSDQAILKVRHPPDSQILTVTVGGGVQWCAVTAARSRYLFTSLQPSPKVTEVLMQNQSVL